jgi:hypothetical protein
MCDDRFRPCEIADITDRGSLVNEPLVDISPRQQPPLSALIAANLANTEALLARLENGVRARSDGQRHLITQLYLQTRRQIEVLVAALELLDR